MYTNWILKGPFLEDVYSVLFDRILTGYYPHDTKLKEEELADEFNISRTPVREILNQLAQDGLVDKVPKKGTRVIGFTVDDVEEIYEIRKSLEIQALRYSASFLSIHGLKEIREELQNLKESTDFKEHERVDSKLHNYFIHASKKYRLIRMLDQLYRLMQRFRELGYRDPKTRDIALDAHLVLVDALILRDIEKAVQILADHIEVSKNNAILQL